MTKVQDIVDFLLQSYPLSLASSFDQGKVGLQFGSKTKAVTRVLITLDGTTDVIEEAILIGAQMVVCHHPFMFNQLLNLDYNSPFGKKLVKVFKNDLNIFAMHTNFDVAVNGMNEILAKELGLENIYSPTEEVGPNSFIRIGEIKPQSLIKFATSVKKILNEPGVRIVGNLDKTIKKVAVVGGSGSGFILDAKKLGCDVIVTGEIRHNNAIDAIDYNIGVIEVSHSVEALYKETIKEILSAQFPDVEFFVSTKDVNPFKYL